MAVLVPISVQPANAQGRIDQAYSHGQSTVFKIKFPMLHFFGFTDVDVFGRKVPMASPERAVLDAPDRPQYAGGLAEVSKIIKKAGPKLDWTQTIQLLRTWKQSALAQRLGYFLDLHQVVIPQNIRSELKSLVKPGNKIYLAQRGRWKMPTSFNSEWMIVENVPRKVLVENNEGKRAFVPRSKNAASGEDSQ